jgi:NAD(P)H-flavin reductase
VAVSTGSGSGGGADQHLLALLRAIRLRQAAPDAVAAGVADAAAALTHLDEINRRRGLETGPPGAPEGADPSALPSAPQPAGIPPPEGWETEEPLAAPLRPDWAHPADAEHPGRAHPADAEHPGWAGAADAGHPRPAGAAAVDAEHPDVPGAAPPARPEAGPYTATPSPVSPPMTAPPAAPTARARRPRRGGFFESGPLMRPAALQPVDPAPDTEAATAAEHQVWGGEPEPPEPAPHRSAGGREPDDGFGTEVGRPSRDRFAGLRARRSPAAPQPPGPPLPGPLPPPHDENDPAARPRWASGQPDSPPRSAPRVPGHEGHAPIAPPMVAAPGRAPAVDGMDPADDALLRETQRLLSTSLTFAGGPGEVAERFRAALQRAHPGLLENLPGDADTQTELLAGGLTWLVHNLDQPPRMVDGCGRLGAALAACGVQPGQLQLVGAALAESMRAGMPAGSWGQDFDVAWRSTWLHVYEWIRHGAETAGYQPTVWTATVVSHELRRPDLAVLRLQPMLPMPFQPGQFARVEVAERPGIWRPYSLAGAPRRDNIVELHVRAKTHTGVSGALVYRTRAGDRVRLSRPEGAMRLPEQPDRDVLMIAGDTGVAPLKALLTELRDTGDGRSAVLFWGVRTLAELYDIDELTAIARAARRVTVVPVVSEGDPGPYASGLVTDAVAAYGEWSRHEVYLAGPPLMLTATSVALHALGVSPDRIHHDPPE